MILAEASATRAKAGWGELKIHRVAGQSAAIAAQAHSPLKLLVPKSRGPSVWAYLSNFGGGLLPGDAIDFHLDIGADATCFLGTQSSTKIFREGEKGAVTNKFHARVASNATLVYAPDVAQGFAASRYQQKQLIELKDASSRLVFLDWYSSGRSARGERWLFSEYASRTEIRVGGNPIFLDSVRLEDGALNLSARMGRFNCLATLVVIGSQPIVIEGFAKRSDATAVMSEIPGGYVLRCAGISVERVAREIFPRLDFVSNWLGDDPFQRKW